MNYRSICSASLALTVAHAAPIPIHAQADLVLGQVSYTSSTLLIPPTASSLNVPTSVVVDPVTRKVFVADGANIRILRYASADSLASGAAAEAVFGQLLFTTTTTFPNSAPDGLGSSAQVLFLDTQNRLWVTDGFANRVLMFENATTRVSTRTADKVFGQPDLTKSTFGITGITTASSMGNPADVCVDAADRLWVADNYNNRVLRFDHISAKASGAAADAVLGQTDLISRDMIDTAAGIGSPLGVAIGANGALYVTCHRQHRVLRFDDPASPTRPNKNANAVFGQPDFTTMTPGLSAVKIEGPFGAWITTDHSLWVTDYYNNRLLRFSNASTATVGAAADGLLGQSSFVIPTAFRTQRGLTLPYSKPFVDGKGALWIADRGNYRVLRFPAPADVVTPPVVPPIVPPVVVVDKTLPLLVLSTKIPKLVTKASLTLKGTASDASGIKSVQYRLGRGPLKLATGTTAWQVKLPLKKGLNAVTLLATDTAGNVSVSKVLKIKRK